MLAKNETRSPLYCETGSLTECPQDTFSFFLLNLHAQPLSS